MAQVCHAYLHHDVHLPSAATPLPPDTDTMIAATVSLTGGWDGHVRIDCTHATAADIGALMLDRLASHLNDDDVTDALGELTNITAGNIKVLLHAPAHLALPVVTIGTQHLRFPACRETNRVVVAWHDETIQLRVLQAGAGERHRPVTGRNARTGAGADDAGLGAPTCRQPRTAGT